jgi:hypothetical protein
MYNLPKKVAQTLTKMCFMYRALYLILLIACMSVQAPSCVINKSEKLFN